MAMPNDLVFVRHGESEANIIQKADKAGAPHENHEIVSERPDWEQRLTDEGIRQAQQAKKWIDANLGGAASFDLRYFSPFLRTRETAAHLGGAERVDWIVDDRVTERSWGIFGMLSKAERAKCFGLTSKLFERSPWFTAPEGTLRRIPPRCRRDAKNNPGTALRSNSIFHQQSKTRR
jgi:broad specificity phosphatase PhoE